MDFLKILGKIKRKIKTILGRSQPASTSYPFHCPVCNNNANMLPLHPRYLSKMHEHRSIHNIFLAETLNLEHYSCAVCNANDRDRLYALYLQKYFSKEGPIKLLDIAPSKPLSSFILNFSNVNHRSSDLYMPGVDDVQDITDMHLYKEGEFDFFICSHVLEHIPDDRTAMAELYRVLKKGGKGIAMVPINLGVNETLEDPSITDEGLRWKFFGQDDHVRMYSKDDFIKRLADCNFTVELLDINYFGAEAYTKAAIFSGSVLYIVSK